MSQELEPIGEDLVVPLTGELVALSDANQVGRALQQVRDMKRQLDDARAVLEDALRLESERQGTKTLHLDGLTAIISGGEKVEYDHQLLAEGLFDAGLPAYRVEDLIVQTVSYRVDQRVAKQLAAANPEYAAILERHRQVVPDRWRVTIKKGRV